MPLGFERLNERTTRPNALINFIRPLPGPTASTAEGILNRVAAVCYPFMKKHMILVQALEEFPTNSEFVGRNFNAGEVIQLVLRNRHGKWLPDRWVMMVMVHELAHCKQMNHSKAFWKVRDEYAADLRELWSKGYTGEGLWGRGRDLNSGQIQLGSVEAGDVPEHLCGGTYGRRRKRRRGAKTKETLSYAERKQRRILKKFGANGQALGADDDTKVKLEGGVAKKGKPRVAGSARGRELRAAAALARFETAKEESVTIKTERSDSDSETEGEYEEVDDEEGAVDVDGKSMVDDRGRALVKICDDEDDHDGNARREMEEIQGIEDSDQHSSRTSRRSGVTEKAPESVRAGPSRTKGSDTSSTAKATSFKDVLHPDEIHKHRPDHTAPGSKTSQISKPRRTSASCSVCSLDNEPGAVTCAACSNVLDLQLVPDYWRCRSSTCQESRYANAGDAGVCGLCGLARSTNTAVHAEID